MQEYVGLSSSVASSLKRCYSNGSLVAMRSGRTASRYCPKFLASIAVEEDAHGRESAGRAAVSFTTRMDHERLFCPAAALK